MTTQNTIQPNWWNFPPFFSKEILPPIEVLVEIYSEQSLGTLMKAMWKFHEATLHMDDDDLEDSRPDLLSFYAIMSRLILATWQMAQETGRVPLFAHD